MSSMSLDFIRNSPISEIGVKAAVGAGVMLGACNTVDWLGVKIFDWTRRTLMNSTPRFISNGIHQIFGKSLAPINQYFERKKPIFGRVVVAPVLEELIFRGAQVLILSRMMGSIPRIALSTLVFNFAHNEAQPGKNFVLLFVGIILGFLAEWNESATRGLLTAILAHSIFNALIDRIYVQILRIGIN
jgi:uncharacterized protein YggT (Ycf19 family)